MPDVSGYAAANGLEGKSDDEIRDAMGDATAQKKHSTILVPPAVPESGHQTVLFNSTHIVCNRGVR
jgi:hypothetical protein